ncbi:MAG: guanylate kinase, partial [Firmicutes bacterium]|nr:guanylate kinase [Bacillota bacterium]
MDEPILFIFTGPSGSGKGSVMRALLQKDPSLHKVVTFTTRPPRPGEQNGFDYRFVSPEEFHRLEASGEVYESEKVYHDYYYGSPRDLFLFGQDSIIELDYKGRQTYLAQRNISAVSIFLLPPSDLNELKRRIIARGQENNLEARLKNALEQVSHAQCYDYIVANDGLLETCVQAVETIIRAER